jgi:hypothetical protein
MATRQQFLAFAQAKPFAAYRVCMVNGTQFTITAPNAASCSDDGLELRISSVQGDRHIDMRCVATLEPAAAIG